jgi:predicted DNA-binding transcriptional regulator AlpA
MSKKVIKISELAITPISKAIPAVSSQAVWHWAGTGEFPKLYEQQRVIRISELASTPTKPGKLPVSPATVWRWVREGKFPKPFKLSASVTVWDLATVEAFIAQRAAGAE